MTQQYIKAEPIDQDFVSQQISSRSPTVENIKVESIEQDYGSHKLSSQSQTLENIKLESIFEDYHSDTVSSEQMNKNNSGKFTMSCGSFGDFMNHMFESEAKTETVNDNGQSRAVEIRGIPKDKAVYQLVGYLLDTFALKVVHLEPLLVETTNSNFRWSPQMLLQTVEMKHKILYVSAQNQLKFGDTDVFYAYEMSSDFRPSPQIPFLINFNKNCVNDAVALMDLSETMTLPILKWYFINQLGMEFIHSSAIVVLNSNSYSVEQLLLTNSTDKNVLLDIDLVIEERCISVFDCSNFAPNRSDLLKFEDIDLVSNKLPTWPVLCITDRKESKMEQKHGNYYYSPDRIVVLGSDCVQLYESNRNPSLVISQVYDRERLDLHPRTTLRSWKVWNAVFASKHINLSEPNYSVVAINVKIFETYLCILHRIYTVGQWSIFVAINKAEYELIKLLKNKEKMKKYKANKGWNLVEAMQIYQE